MKLFFVLVVFQVLSAGAFGEENDKPRAGPHIQFQMWQSAIHPEILDIDSIAGYYLDAVEALHFGADLVVGRNPSEQIVWGRIIRSALAGTALFYLEHPLRGAAHEYSHFQALSRAGLKKFEIFSPQLGVTLTANPLNVFATRFSNWFGSGVEYIAYVSAGRARELLENPRGVELRAIASAAGINAQQYYTSELAKRLMERGLSFLDAMTYFVNVYATMSYPLTEDGDIAQYVEQLAKLGVEADPMTVGTFAQLPRLVSGSSLSLLVALVDYYVTGDKLARPLALNIGNARIYWPEFTSYLTLFGPTVGAEEYVGLGNHRFSLGYEYALPTGVSDVSASWSTTFFRGDVGVRTSVYYNPAKRGFWTEDSVAVFSVPWLTLGIKFVYGSGYTFRREVAGKIPDFLEEQEADVKGFVSVHLSY